MNWNVVWFIVLFSMWGASFIAIKSVVEICPPLFGAFLRCFIALIFIFVVACGLRRNLKVSFERAKAAWIVGLFAQAIPFCFLFWGERFIAPGIAGILNGTVPIWTFVLTQVLLKKGEHISLASIFGLLLGMVGLVTVFWTRITLSGSSTELLGLGAVLLMAIAYGIGTTLARKLLSTGQRMDLYAGLVHQLLASTLFLALVSLVLEGPEIFVLSVNIHDFFFARPVFSLAIFYLGVCSTGLAFIIYNHLIREWDSVRASAVTYVVPCAAVFFDFLFFGNIPTFHDAMGGTLILVSVYLVHIGGQSPRKSSA